MLRILLSFTLVVLFSIQLLAQETLDLEAKSKCELFPVKKGFDKQERLEQMLKLNGESVTVFLLKGKNQIKSKFSGRIEQKMIQNSDLSLKVLTAVLVVAIDLGNGKREYRFAHTDQNNSRIYLSSCLEQ